MLNGGKFLNNNNHNNDIYTTIELLEKKYPDHDFKWHNNHLGTKAIGLCPIHGDRKPSLSVHIWHNIPYYNCFACDFKGNLYDLTGKQRKFTPEEKEQYEKQIKATELAKQFKQNLINSRGIAKEYLKKRLGVKNKIITKLITVTGSIGLIPKGYKAPNGFELLEYTARNSEQLVFIYTNPSGLITQFHLRCPETKEFKILKIADIGVLNANYIINPLAQSPIIWIVEGEFDALTPLANIIDEKGNTAENIIAIGSTNNLNTMLINYIIRYDRIPVIAMDWDNAGRKAIIGLIDNAKKAKIDLNKIWIIPESPGYDAKDFDELFAGRKFDELKYIFKRFKLITLAEFAIKTDEEKQRKLRREYQNYPDNLKTVIYKQYNIDEEDEKILLPEVMNKDLPALDWIFSGFRTGTVGLLLGTGGIGKSFLAMQLAACTADDTGTLNFLGLFNGKRGKTGYASIEDPALDLKYRIKNIMRDFISGDKNILESVYRNLTITSLAGKGFSLINKNYKGMQINLHWVEWLTRFAEDKRLVILDTLSRIHQLDGNSNSDMAVLLNLVEMISVKTGASILILHHVSKAAILNGVTDSSASRGASALVDNSRFVMQMQALSDNDIQTLDVDQESKRDYAKILFTKLNYSKPIDDRLIRKTETGILMEVNL